MKTAVVITNGSIKDYNAATQICTDKFVICADGAMTHCMKMSIIPDVWVGDKDSCTLDADEFSYATTRSEIILLNPQ